MKNERPPFSPSGDFIVGREFRFAGRDFRPGEKFPQRRLACSPRRLRQLYDGRYLNSPVPVEESIEEQIEEEPEDLLDEAPDNVAVDSPKIKKKKKKKSLKGE